MEPPQSKMLKSNPLTAGEVAQIVLKLQALVGAQLQDCLQTSSEFGLSFYHQKESVWLWFDMNPLKPVLVRQKVKTPQGRKIQRPLSLFLKSRFVGRRLKSVSADPSLGRVITFGFHRSKEEADQSPIEIEMRLFPHGQNVIVRDGSKQVAELKPKDLSPSLTVPVHQDSRSWEEIEAAWFASRRSAAKEGDAVDKSGASLEQVKREKEWRKAVEKKRNAILRMQDELVQKTDRSYAELGEWLKVNGTLEVPSEWRTLVDDKKSISWNIEECFRRAKENLRKSEGTRARIELVEKELKELESKGPQALNPALKGSSKKETESLLSRAEARGRRYKIGEDLEVYIGKSAADNLAILRKAQPFDYWLHLRDQPGSHAILRRSRGRSIKDSEFEQAGRWVFEQTLGARARDSKGERFDLLIVECRFVRPIKGDKLGRVNYSNDRVLTLRY